MYRVALAGPFVLCLLAACSGSADTANGSSLPSFDAGGTGGSTGGVAGGLGGGPSGGSGDPGSAQPFSLYGSFDLTLDAISSGGTANTGAAADDVSFRVDVPALCPSCDPASWRAVVTPRWGAPSEFSVNRQGNVLQLSGQAFVPATATASLGDEYWTSFFVTTDATGDLTTGKVTAAGQLATSSYVMGATAALTATGSLVRDRTKPQARLSIDSPIGVTDAKGNPSLLPWEPLTFKFAELVSLQRDPTVTIDAVDGNSPGTSPNEQLAAWTSVGDLVSDSTKTIQLAAFWQSWPAHTLRGTVKLGTSAEDRYTDIVRNAGDPVDGEAFSVVGLGVAKNFSQSFEANDPSAFLTWGGATWKPSGDDHCADGGCVVLDVDNRACGVVSRGVALRLRPTTGMKASSVKVVLRAKTPDMMGIAAASFPVITVQVACAGCVSTLSAPSATVDFSRGASLAVDLPAGFDPQGEIGIAVRGGGKYATTPCDVSATDSPPQTHTEIVVDSVSLVLGD